MGKILVMALNIGFLGTFFLRSFISKRIRESIGKKKFRKLMYSSCPRWLKLTAAIIITYGIIMAISSLVGAFPETYTPQEREITLNKCDRSLSALWISIYTFESAALYCYKKLSELITHDAVSTLRIENTGIVP
jgi:hypothetical protein